MNEQPNYAIKNLCDLQQQDLPVVVKPYKTGEGNKGYCLVTATGDRVVMESGSYGYDTAFLGDDAAEVAQKTANFLNQAMDG